MRLWSTLLVPTCCPITVSRVGAFTAPSFSDNAGCQSFIRTTTALVHCKFFRVAALSCALAIGLPLWAREKSDIIVMNNGDRLTGEIKGLDSGVLYVNFDYILGTSSVQWSKVHHLESKQLFIVKTQSGLVYSGTLRSVKTAGERPTQIQVTEAPDQKIELDQRQIVEMTQTSERFWQRLNGQVNTGIQYSKGNEATQFNLGSEVAYPRERWGADITYDATVSSSTGTTPSGRNAITVDTYRLLRWDNWFYSGLANFLQSSEQQISLRTDLGGGIGRYLKNSNRAKVSLLGGLAWQSTKYSPSFIPGTQNVAAALVAGEAKFFVFDKTNLTFSGYVFPALTQPGRVFVNTNASYYVKIFGNLTWNISFYGNWDNQPPQHLSGSDYGTSAGLGWTFGNR
jgi:hypothetical protein